MKFFRLVKGELNKILMRPLLYVLTIVLVFAIFISYFMFMPQKRTDFNTITVYDNCQNVSEVYMEYNSNLNTYGKQKTNEKIDDALNIVNIIGNYKTDPTLDNLKSNINTIKNNFNIYLNISSTTPVDINQEINAYNNFSSSVSSLQTNFQTAMAKSNIVILVKTENFNNIISILNKAQAKIKSISISSHEDHIKLQNEIKEMQLVDNLNSMFFEIQTKSFSDDQISNLYEYIEISKNYMLEVDQNIEDIKNLETTSKEDLANLAVRYYLIGLNMLKLTQQIAKYMPYLGFSDEEINSYYEFKNYNIYSYQIKEEITKDTFLVKNNSVSTDYSNTFSPSIASAKQTNAFDLVYYGLEITSFVLIIFTVVLVAGSLAGEQSNGTLKLLLIRPYSRKKVLTSKLLSSLIFAGILLLFTTTIFFLMGLFIFGVDFSPIIAVFNAQTAFVISPVLLLLIYLLCIMIKITFFVLISLAISTIFRSNVAAVGISIVLYVVLCLMGNILAGSFWYGFLPFSNFDLFKFFGGSFISSGASTGTLFSASIFHNISFWYSLIIDTVVCLILTICSYIVFAKREIK